MSGIDHGRNDFTSIFSTQRSTGDDLGDQVPEQSGLSHFAVAAAGSQTKQIESSFHG
jgi:hypothetical protein